MRGSEIFVQTLIKQKVDSLFGITGGVIIPFFDTLYDNMDKIRYILTRHEQGAAHAAEGYAKALGKVGVCVGTSGPGACNLVTGIADAYMDSVPILAIGGQVSTNLIGNDAFQETDMMGITNPITKHNYQIRETNKIPETIMKAMKIAIEGRPGPVYIDLPKDIQLGEFTGIIPTKVEIPGFNPTIYPNPRQLQKAVELILKAENPVLISGGGVIISNAYKKLFKFAEILACPVMTTTMGKGGFPETHPLSIGVMGMHGQEAANWAVINSDLLITIGCRFSDRVTGDTKTFAEKAKVIHIDIDPAEIGKNVGVDVPIVGDAGIVIDQLITLLAKEATKLKNKHSAWVARAKKILADAHALEERDIQKEGLTQKFVCKELSKLLSPDDIVTTGVGQHQMFGEHFIDFTKPRKWITSGGAGTMGFGLPAAMGAKVALPDVEVYDLDGDGSFQMTSQELATIKEHKIKVIPIICNNGCLGMVRQWLELFSKKRYSGVQYSGNPDFGKLAEAYGLKGITVTRKSEYVDALKQAKKSDETTVLDVKVAAEENIYPMLPPASSLKEIIGGKVIFNQTWDDVLKKRAK
ncbi:MAG TPA: biosynthetic-type acetolactate synthase large subunit [Candidatus Nanoarchaeia archaeon]|nr:biosynthetic-type acetolactate synthase large subunit [Candidatus Nanoarchaeia archaeon]